MNNDKVVPVGTLHVLLTDENGNTKYEAELKNLVVNSGLSYIASRIKDATATAMSHIAVGTSAATAVAAQTALGTEISRVAFASATQVTTNAANDSMQFVATFGANVGTGALTEAGIFNAASAGTMLSRTVFASINKAAGDTLTITWKIIIL